MTFGGILEALGGRLGVEIENAGGAAAACITMQAKGGLFFTIR